MICRNCKWALNESHRYCSGCGWKAYKSVGLRLSPSPDFLLSLFKGIQTCITIDNQSDSIIQLKDIACEIKGATHTPATAEIKNNESIEVGIFSDGADIGDTGLFTVLLSCGEVQYQACVVEQPRIKLFINDGLIENNGQSVFIDRQDKSILCRIESSEPLTICGFNHSSDIALLQPMIGQSITAEKPCIFDVDVSEVDDCDISLTPVFGSIGERAFSVELRRYDAPNINIECLNFINENAIILVKNITKNESIFSKYKYELAE